MLEPEGAPLKFFFSLASHLGKSLDEVRHFSDAEIAGWRAYFSAENARRKP